MVTLIQPPDPHALLPPLLACLPTAFASARAPPALLPLLSPILSQRLQYSTPSASDNWLRLLCWDNAKGETLKENVENTDFEPHPSSGEIEVGDVDEIKYKRLDEETLRAQLALAEWPFAPVFLWCAGGEGSTWKLAELLPSPEIDDTWSATISQANESAKARIVSDAFREADHSSSSRNLTVPGPAEDDYWAQYDKSPGRTPARKSSMVPENGQASESDYYERYGAVQPAMDNHDPEEEMGEAGESTLNGNALQQLLSRPSEQQEDGRPPPYQDTMQLDNDEKEVEVSQPVPESPPSRGGSDTVARLENAAERYASSEVGIRQHISTSMKSMYRLAKSAGMDREEFDRIITRELETLSIFDRDD